MAGRYHTRQYESILEHLTGNPGTAFTAREISQSCQTGLATVYRQLECLVAQQKARKITTADGARFQYMAEGATRWFYVRCDSCGTLTPISCSRLVETMSHLGEEHGFQIDTAKTVLHGRCQSCRL